MKVKSLQILVITSLLFVTVATSQTNYRIQNGIGIYSGVSQFDIDTDQLAIKSSNG